MENFPLKENGIFRTENTKHLTKSFNIAVLFNLILSEEERDKIEIANLVKLNPIDLSLETFFELFYNTYGKYFTIKKSYNNIDVICFNKQTYPSNNSYKNRFSLNDQLLHSYELLNDVDVENISSSKKITVNQEAFKLQSLSNINGSLVALDWDQVIQGLIENNIIERSSNPLSIADVSLEVTTNIYSKALKVWTSVLFTYRTKLDGYVNVSDGGSYSNDIIKPYSNEVPFYSSIYNKKINLEDDYEVESYNGNDEISVDLEIKKEDEKKNYSETLKELENESLPHLDYDENSVIYTINHELLNKINSIKNESDASVNTWLKD